MRVLHFVHQYPPDYVGGTELYTRSLTQAQGRLGHRVAVLAPFPRESDELLEESAESEVTIYRVPVGPRSGTAVFRSTFGNERIERAMVEALKRFQPDVVHIQHLMGLPLSGVRLLQDRGLPFVINLHDYWYRCANAQLLTNFDLTLCEGPDAHYHNCARCALARAGLPDGALLTPATAPIMRRRNERLVQVFAAADCVIAPNDFVHATYAAMGMPMDRAIVRSWGQDQPADLTAIRDRAAVERQARPGDTIRLGYIGGLSYQKGLHVLIDAVNRLQDESVALDIYGNLTAFPDYVSEIQQLATHSGIRFLGPLSRDEFWPRLAALDALVLPTLWYEASPLTIDEAFAAGTPVLGSRIGALPSMIREGADGRLFTPGNAEELAGLLLSLHDDPAQLARLRAGIRPVKTMDMHAREIAGQYEVVVAGNVRKR